MIKIAKICSICGKQYPLECSGKQYNMYGSATCDWEARHGRYNFKKRPVGKCPHCGEENIIWTKDNRELIECEKCKCHFNCIKPELKFTYEYVMGHGCSWYLIAKEIGNE